MNPPPRAHEFDPGVRARVHFCFGFLSVVFSRLRLFPLISSRVLSTILVSSPLSLVSSRLASSRSRSPLSRLASSRLVSSRLVSFRLVSSRPASSRFRDAARRQVVSAHAGRRCEQRAAAAAGGSAVAGSSRGWHTCARQRARGGRWGARRSPRGCASFTRGAPGRSGGLGAVV